MKLNFDLEGVDDFALDLSAATDYLGDDLRNAVLQSGDAAIAAMQGDHPYTDRTFLLSGGMRCRLFGRNTKTMAEAAVTFLAPYAGYVNDGTSKSKPYPFIPIGMATARDELETLCVDALDHFCQLAR